MIIPGTIDPESVVLVGSLAAPWWLLCGSLVFCRCGSLLFFNENPRVKLRLAARGRTRGPKVTLKWTKVAKVALK